MFLLWLSLLFFVSGFVVRGVVIFVILVVAVGFGVVVGLGDVVG